MITLIDVIQPGDVILDLDAVPDADAALDKLLGTLKDNAAVHDWEALQTDLRSRLHKGMPLVEDAFLLPHARTTAVSSMVMAAARLQTPITVRGEANTDGEARFIFLLVGPRKMAKEYLRLAGTLARIFRQEKAIDELLRSEEATDFIAVLDRWEHKL